MKNMGKSRRVKLASRCKNCDDIFVVDRKLMDKNKPDDDPRVVHLRECLKDMNIKRLGDNFETIQLTGKDKHETRISFMKLYLTGEQFNQLTKHIKRTS